MARTSTARTQSQAPTQSPDMCALAKAFVEHAESVVEELAPPRTPATAALCYWDGNFEATKRFVASARQHIAADNCKSAVLDATTAQCSARYLQGCMVGARDWNPTAAEIAAEAEAAAYAEKMAVVAARSTSESFGDARTPRTLRQRVVHAVTSRLPTWWPWAAAGGVVAVGVGTILWVRHARAKAPLSLDEENVLYLARLLIVEAGNYTDDWAPIAWVAINRARNNYGKYGQTIRSQVDTYHWFGTANEGYIKLHTGKSSAGANPFTGTVWDRAVTFARDALAGNVPSPIGNRMQFVHYSGLKTCDAVGRSPGESADGRICDEHPTYGWRWAPTWIVAPSKGGVAKNEPIMVGRTTVA